MENKHSEQRNFATVANDIINVLEYHEDTREKRLDRLVLVSQVVSKRPHLVMQISERIQKLEIESKMDYSNYKKFVEKIDKIQRDGIYLPPYGRLILWEKLSRLCYIYLSNYKNTEWGKKASLIIRGKK